MGHLYVKENETFNTSQNGVVPKPTAQDVTDGKYLKADGTWGTPSGGGGGAVTSVNGQTGAVVLDANDVGALPDSTTIPTALSDLSDDSTHRVVTDTEKSTWNGKSDFSGSYNDLTDKPTIPDEITDLSDVNISSPTDGQVLTYDNASSKWINANAGSSATTTNPNLLINPWFTVNQRGYTSATASSGAYSADRWKTSSSSGTIALSSNGVTITPSGSDVFYLQVFEDSLWNDLNGKEITVSLKLSDGTIYSGSGTFSTSANIVYLDETNFNIGSNSSRKALVIGVKSVSPSVTIRAVKLEIGSTSTLHLDAAPEYTTELLKCQRYFRRIGTGATSATMGLIEAESSASARTGFMLPVPMRTTPTLTTGGTFALVFEGTSYPVTTVMLNTSNESMLRIEFRATGMTTGACGRAVLAANSYIDLSAEL